MTFYALLIVLALFVALSTAAFCDSALPWQTAYSTDKPAAGQGVTVPGVTKLEAAHGGGNRIYWRVTFDRPFVTNYTVLILYLDTDNDPATGRPAEPFQGTDRMLYVADGVTGANITGPAGDGRGTISRIEGNSVTFRDDLACLIPRIKDAKTEFDYHVRARVLHHKAAAPNDQTGTEWLAVSVRIDPRKSRPLEAAPGEVLIQDLVTYRDSRDTLQIRFTTPEPMISEVTGDGKPAHKWSDGTATNHGWSLSGVLESGKVRYRIKLSDDLGQEVVTQECEFTGKATETPVDTVERRKVALTLDADEEAIAACKGGLAAVKWPAAGSVPFPRGALYSPEHARLLDANGVERQAQVSVLSRWPDESIRWLLVEFIAQLPQEAGGVFAVEYGRSVARAEVPAGDVRFAGVKDLWTDFFSAKEGDKTIEINWPLAGEPQKGPIHQVSYTKGQYSSGCCSIVCRYEARTHGFAGLPFALIEHTLMAEQFQPMARLQSLRLVFPVCDAGWQPPTDAARLAQIDPPEATELDRPRAVGVDTPQGRAYVAVREFQRNWPKAIAAGDGHIAVDLFPKLDENQYAGRKEPRELLYFWFDKGFYTLRAGAQKTHEILYVPAGSGVSQEQADAYAFWLDNPPVLRANPKWVCLSKAAGPLASDAESPLPRYEELVRQGFEETKQTQLRLKEHGFANFGDWFGERGRNWGNNEYDLPEGMWLQWLRSGDYRYFRRSIEAAHHMADIDVTHADVNPMNVGRMWGHSLGHTGGYFEPGSFGMEAIFCSGFYDLGHTYCSGLLHAYLATGNRRYLENGLAVADQLARHGTVGYKMATERTAGWPLVALTAAYDLTRDPYYLNACKIIARAALNKQHPERGGWFARIGECKHDPPHYGGKPFMVGTLLTGLSRLHRLLPEASPEDREFKKTIGGSLVRGCDYLLKEAWMEQYSGFFYAQCPDYYNRACAAAPWMVGEGLAYASEITGDPKYIETARRALETVLKNSSKGFGKSLGMETAWTPRLLAALARSKSFRMQ